MQTLCLRVSLSHEKGSFTSSIRVYVLSYFRSACSISIPLLDSGAKLAWGDSAKNVVNIGAL
jgi:predicted DNA-binding ribbon-helix-helix protein